MLSPSMSYSNIVFVSEMAQTSVFPTILDLYHIQNDKWKGVGQSIYMPDNISNSSYEHCRKNNRQKISDYIIGKQYLN